jgi:hypothetical protein
MIKQTAVRYVGLEINACKKCPYFRMELYPFQKDSAFLSCAKWFLNEVVKAKKVDLELEKWITTNCKFDDVGELHEDKKHPLPEYGDLFTVKKFVEICEEGGFIDWDGSGFFSDGKYVYDNEEALPSQVKDTNFNPRNFSHVAWFNK